VAVDTAVGDRVGVAAAPQRAKIRRWPDLVEVQALVVCTTVELEQWAQPLRQLQLSVLVPSGQVASSSPVQKPGRSVSEHGFTAVTTAPSYAALVHSSCATTDFFFQLACAIHSLPGDVLSLPAKNSKKPAVPAVKLPIALPSQSLVAPSNFPLPTDLHRHRFATGCEAGQAAMLFASS